MIRFEITHLINFNYKQTSFHLFFSPTSSPTHKHNHRKRVKQIAGAWIIFYHDIWNSYNQGPWSGKFKTFKIYARNQRKAGKTRSHFIMFSISFVKNEMEKTSLWSKIHAFAARSLAKIKLQHHLFCLILISVRTQLESTSTK